MVYSKRSQKWISTAWKLYIWLFYGENLENCISLSHFYNIDHRKSNLICMCRSTPSLRISAIILNIRLIWLRLYYVGIAQHPNITLIKIEYYIYRFVFNFIIVAETTSKLVENIGWPSCPKTNMRGGHFASPQLSQ